MTQATTRMNLEDIMLSAVSQLQEDSYCTNLLKELPRVVKFIDTQIRMAVARGSVRENRKLVFNEYRVPV